MLNDIITSNTNLIQCNTSIFKSCDTFNDERNRFVEKRKTKLSSFYEDD